MTEPTTTDRDAAPNQADPQLEAERGGPPGVADRRPEVSIDDTDLGWGDLPGEGDSRDEWYRRERPPHHGD